MTKLIGYPGVLVIRDGEAAFHTDYVEPKYPVTCPTDAEPAIGQHWRSPRFGGVWEVISISIYGSVGGAVRGEISVMLPDGSQGWDGPIPEFLTLFEQVSA